MKSGALVSPTNIYPPWLAALQFAFSTPVLTGLGMRASLLDIRRRALGRDCESEETCEDMKRRHESEETCEEVTGGRRPHGSSSRLLKVPNRDFKDSTTQRQ